MEQLHQNKSPTIQMNVEDEAHRTEWANRLGCTLPELYNAVATVGPSADRVAIFLQETKQLPLH